MANSIKRIIASVICVSLLASFAVFAKDNTDGEEPAIPREPGVEETDIPSKNRADGADVYAGYTPDYKEIYDSFQYDLFEDILREYTSTHLYEFTEQEAIEAFVRKLLKENPELTKMYINTLLGTMDEYSAYYESGLGLANDGSSSGYGIVISDENHYVIRGMGISEKGVYITEVMENSPAALAGITAGDKIVSVQGIPVSGLTYDGATELIRGLPYVGKELFDDSGNSLGIPNEPEFIIDEATGKKKYPLCMVLKKPDSQQYTAKLIKGRIIPSEISVDIPENESYAYIQIASFRGQNLVEDFRKALDTAKKARRSDLIIDLRNNGGGVLEFAVEMANMLIADEGRILYYTNYKNRDTLTVTKSLGGGDTFEKITVMINGGTASAAELFAMILRFNCGATLVGGLSYGKAVGQNSYGFANGDMFTITAFEILDPIKKSYNKKGLVPDVECAPAMKKLDFPKDLEVFNYINYKELSEGSTGDTVRGLERRLELMGFLREEYADGVYDEHTTAAIKSFRMYYYKTPEGTLDDSDVAIITNVINKYKNYFYYYDAELEVAKMSFSSRSQAKRLAKEIEKASKEVLLQKQEYEDSVIAALIAEENAADEG